MNHKIYAIFFSILLAILAGYYTGVDKEIAGVSYYKIYSLIGQLFLNALKLIVVPLVAASIISGTAKLASEESFGSLGRNTFLLFLSTSAIAIAIGWMVAEFIPLTSPLTHALSVDSGVQELAKQANEGVFEKVEQILLTLIPSNILAVAVQGQMLGLIGFCLVFGFFLSKIESDLKHIVLGVWKGIFQVMLKITEFIMLALPVGVFALVAKTVASTGLANIASVGYYFAAVCLGLFLYMFGALSLILRIFSRVSPLAHLKAMYPALLTAFSTSSTAATLPVTIDCVEKRGNVSNKVASFALPLAASLNLAGSSLQVLVSVFFIAEVYGVPLHFSTQLLIFFLTWILSIGVAGIPSAALISIVIILTALGLPVDGIGLIMVVERFLDMLRTTVNVYSNSCCAVILDTRRAF